MFKRKLSALEYAKDYNPQGKIQIMISHSLLIVTRIYCCLRRKPISANGRMA